MKRAMRLVILANLLFLVLRSLPSFNSKPLYYILYIASFVLPSALALYLGREGRTKEKYLSIDRGGVELLALSLFPTLALVTLFAFLTSLLLGAFGFNDAFVIEGGYLEAMAVYALLPAVLEELLFRYVPLRLISHRSGRATLLFSSLFFSLAHCNLFQIPYAFLAGLIFIAVDMAAGSVLPSLIIHFLNNAADITLKFYGTDKIRIGYYIAVGVLAVVSFAVLYLRRKRHSQMVREILSPRADDREIDMSVMLVIFPTLFVAITNLIQA